MVYTSILYNMGFRISDSETNLTETLKHYHFKAVPDSSQSSGEGAGWGGCLGFQTPKGVNK